MLKRLSMTVLTGIVAVALLVGLNVLAAKHDWRWDATSNKRYSLSETTKAALASLTGPVHAVAFFRPSEGSSQTEDMLELFAQQSKQFTYEIVDPDRAPFRAKQMDVRQSGAVVVESDGRSDKVVFPDEQALVNAVVKATSRRKSVVRVVTGHGELDVDAPGGHGATTLKKLLTDQGGTVQPITLAKTKTVPDDVDLLLILGPTDNYLDHEIKVLDEYVDRGGRVLVALAPETPTNLDAWITKQFGLKMPSGFVVDTLSQAMTGDAMTPLAQKYSRMPITRDFALMTLFPTSGALLAADGNAATAKNATEPQGLAFSGEQTWLETNIQGLHQGTAAFNPGEDTMGPFWLGAVYEGPARGAGSANATAAAPAAQANATNATVSKAPETRGVFFADQDFLSDDFIVIGGDKDLARNSLNWLLEHESLISVNKPKPVAAFLVMTPLQRAVMTYVPVVIAPLACIILAIVVAMRRRRPRYQRNPGNSGKA
ncbi:GldG family protein [Oceanidesulfovibrio marinus]|uniref:Uncharacterized protein n=1 Tax=Oceanidesulfovibrio marinus TaxID=370038 RepID=A0A6P1ZDD0_9BACT|nr:GldG family protein [Oceanidesulfovibrio marinus]TVM32337.1 hypothetical protein DQK91_15775 [Oceanidesulfovibrio marinus]